MANARHLRLVRQKSWNKWRADHPDIILDLSGANLSGLDLYRTNLSGANLVGADLSVTNLTEASLLKTKLGGADLSRATLEDANLGEADLNGADIRGAGLHYANLTAADLNGADLSWSILVNVNLNWANLVSANLSGAILAGTDFAAATLLNTKGLEECVFQGPCILDHRAIQYSGRLPVSFLRGCGLPDSFINYLPSLLNEAIQYFSCFVSHSTKDREFANRLHADLQARDVRCWFAPHDMKGGDRIYDQIDRAIQVHDRVLLILSEASMASKWVETEIRKAFAKEKRENRRVLFPLALVPFEQARAWECFDSDTGEDLARKVREYFIPDFSNWKDHDSYAKAFDRLLRDLKAEPQDKATA